MNIELKLNKDFERCVESLVTEFGEDFEILNGFHNSQLNFSDFIDSFVQKNLAEVTIDNNASSANRDIVSLCSEKGKPSDKLIAFSKIFQELKKRWGLATAQEWLRSEWLGAFYLHDAPSATYKPYCFAYDLGRLAREGLFFLDTYNNKPAEHLTTFTDNLIEYISFMCNRSSGAVGIPNVLVWTMYFWKKDIDNNYFIRDPEYYLRQTFQKLIYRLNQPFMRLDQSAFVNVSIFDKYYYEALFGDLTFPDGTYAIDYVDMFIEHEKIFMEVVSDIRKENMFTFPVLTYSLLKRKNIPQEEIDYMLKTREFNVFMDNEFARWCSDHNCQWNDSNFFMSDDVTTLSNCCFDGSQELFYYDEHGNKILTNFKQFVETRLSEDALSKQGKVIEKLEPSKAFIIDPNTNDKAEVLAVTKLPNFHHKLIVIEKEDGSILKVTPDQKLFDNNSKSLVTAQEILEHPEKYDI